MDFASMLDTDEPQSYASLLEERKDNYKLWPTEGERVALIDADLLPYKVGFTIDAMEYFSAQRSVELGDADCIEDTYQFKDAADQMNWIINRWVEGSGCDAAKLYITDSPNQYRFKVAISQEYKGKRLDKDKPPFFYELKRYLVREHGAIVATDNEADDLICIELNKEAEYLSEQGIEKGSELHKEVSTLVACSIDKDIRIACGMHYDPDKGEHIFVAPLGELNPKYSNKEVNHYETWNTIKGVPIDPSSIHDAQRKLLDTYKRGANKGTLKTKRVLVGKRPSSAIDKLRGTGLKFFYSQLITGDDVDCYAGLKGKGATYAYNLLDSAKSEQELFDRVFNAYRDILGEELTFRDKTGRQRTLRFHHILAEQGNLAWMQTREGELWSKLKGLECPWYKE